MNALTRKLGHLCHWFINFMIMMTRCKPSMSLFCLHSPVDWAGSVWSQWSPAHQHFRPSQKTFNNKIITTPQQQARPLYPGKSLDFVISVPISVVYRVGGGAWVLLGIMFTLALALQEVGEGDRHRGPQAGAGTWARQGKLAEKNEEESNSFKDHISRALNS